MIFNRKAKPQDEKRGLYAKLDELIEQKKYLPYINCRQNRITSYQAGDIRSAFKGRGMELEEVRAYEFGDDVRDIDWRVTARKGGTYTKIYSEEKDREVYVVLDLSPRMLFGTKKELKSVSASKLAALLGWQSLANKDRFGLVLFDGYRTEIYKPKNNPKSLMAILKAVSDKSLSMLSNIKEDNISPTKSLSDPLQYLQYNLKSKAIVFIISDFYDFDDNVRKSLVSLTRKGRVYCANIYDVIEEIPPESGEYMVEYNKEKLIFDSNPDSFKDIYYHYFAARRKGLERFCDRFGCQYIGVRTDRPLYKQLKIL